MSVTNGFTRNVSADITMNDQGSDPRIAQAAEAIRSADALLIGAGAGLSAAAGYDFTSEERFARNFPGMLQYGFTQKFR